MKLSTHWLRQLVPVDVDDNILAEKLTLLGLEVNGISKVSGEFSGVVVGEVIACEKHSNADKLRVTQVNVGEEILQIVCGAHNVRTGLKVPCARVGAVLSGNFTIKAVKIRGMESRGMLCSGSELGILESAEELFELPEDAEVGQDFGIYFQMSDRILDVDLTPNRGDCLSILGLAREVSTGFSLVMNNVEVPPVSPGIEDTFPIEVLASKECPLYLGRVIRGVDTKCQAPFWMKERLRRSGIRSINPVVDVTNYVMLELGQPMHGFDLDRLSQNVCVRLAHSDEKLLLLDGRTIELTEDVLVIVDKNEVLALAGVMGGEKTGVSVATQNVFLESAFFDPVVISGKARFYGLYTESAHRFERGVDYQIARQAMERATYYILSICGGEVGPVVEVMDENFIVKEKKISLRADKIIELLGMHVECERIEEILVGLGFLLHSVAEGNWMITVPSWRFDISIEEDLVEEVARIVGYDQLPEELPEIVMKTELVAEGKISDSILRQAMVDRDYHEVITYSFVDPKLQRLFDLQYKETVLSNPISNDLSVMRISLLPGLLNVFKHNESRQQRRIRLFEMGQVFIQEENQKEITQKFYLSAVISGDRDFENWQIKSEGVDFYDIKGDLQALTELCGCADQFEFKQGSHAVMHPGQCADVYRNDKIVGFLGALHPRVIKHLSITEQCFMFEVELASLYLGRVPEVCAFSKFPVMRRDLAFIVKKTVEVGNICTVVKRVAGQWLQQISVFDVYEGDGLDVGCKSVALSITLQHSSRTLEEEEVEQLVKTITKGVVNDFQATLRM